MSSGHRDYDYLEWIARLTSHIPDRGTQLVHYYGAYSNVLPSSPDHPREKGNAYLMANAFSSADMRVIVPPNEQNPGKAV